MDVCHRCGASRSDDLAWCGQCFLRFDAPSEGSQANDIIVLASSDASEGDLTLPVWIRAAMTIATIGGGVALIVGLGPWWDLGKPMWALGLVLLTIYAGLGGVLVARLWAPETFSHREEHIVVLDRRTMEAVEERQRGLTIHDEPA